MKKSTTSYTASFVLSAVLCLNMFWLYILLAYVCMYDLFRRYIKSLYSFVQNIFPLIYGCCCAVAIALLVASVIFAKKSNKANGFVSPKATAMLKIASGVLFWLLLACTLCAIANFVVVKIDNGFGHSSAKGVVRQILGELVIVVTVMLLPTASYLFAKNAHKTALGNQALQDAELQNADSSTV